MTNGDGVSGNPTFATGSNIPKKDAANTWTAAQRIEAATNGALVLSAANNSGTTTVSTDANGLVVDRNISTPSIASSNNANRYFSFDLWQHTGDVTIRGVGGADIAINLNGHAIVNGFTASTVGLTVKGAASPTVDQVQIKDNADAVRVAVDSSYRLKIGTSGTPVSTVLSATASLNFAGGTEDLTIALTGAVVGDTVSLGIPAGSVTADSQFYGWVSTADQITIRHYGAGDPASGTFRATLIRF